MSSTSYSQAIEVHPDANLYIEVTEPADGNDRPTLVFLHYWGGSTRTWSKLIPLLAHHPTVAVDFRGWGASTGPSDPDAYSISQLADDVETLIRDHLRLQSVILVGLSMGAKVAQAIAGRCRLDAAVLKGVILISPSPPTPLHFPPEASAQQIHAYDDWANAEFVARNVLISSPQALNDETIKFVVADMLKGCKHARAAWPSYGMAEDITDLMVKIDLDRVPVLVIAAAQDVVEPLERVRKEVCGHISGAEMVIVPGSGHLSPLEAPEEIARHILGLLSKIKVQTS